MDFSLRAGIILTNSKNEYLIVKDVRSGMYGFPKGGKEEFETFLFDTGVREMKEETGFEFGKDYYVDPAKHVCSLTVTKKYSSLYYFFVGKALKNDLYYTSKLDENIEEIRFVSYKDLVICKKYSMNRASSIALQKVIKTQLK
jgi:8-oxo-dGTP pyrophosphatase MutT (NUDIX family)